MNPLRTVCVIVAVIMATGCVGLSSIKMRKADRAQIKTVKIRVDSTMPEMFFLHKPESLVFIGGWVGELTKLAMSDTTKAQTLALMESNKIDIPTIVQSEFSRAMQTQRDFQVIESSTPADAEMVLFVNEYGLNQEVEFSSILYPSLNLSASLKRPDGTVVWQRTDGIGGVLRPSGYPDPENFVAYMFNDYIEKPDRLRQAWSNAAEIVSQKLVRELTSRE